MIYPPEHCGCGALDCRRCYPRDDAQERDEATADYRHQRMQDDYENCCPDCGGEGIVMLSECGPDEWGEDCFCEEDRPVICPTCDLRQRRDPMEPPLDADTSESRPAHRARAMEWGGNND